MSLMLNRFMKSMISRNEAVLGLTLVIVGGTKPHHSHVHRPVELSIFMKRGFTRSESIDKSRVCPNVDFEQARMGRRRDKVFFALHKG